MKTKHLLSLFALLWIFSFSIVTAQTQGPHMQSDTAAYPFTRPAFYIGAQGGYLLSNKDFADNPAYYLTSGKFAELNVGWRSKNSWLGWSMNAGRLSITRKSPSGAGAPAEFNGYDVIQSTSPNWMWQKNLRDERAFQFDNASTDTASMTNLGSWYLMTGPQFWLGKKRWQASLSLDAGVGLTDVGYYFAQGHGSSSNSLQYDYFSQANNTVAGPVDVQMQGRYQAYGMSQKTFMNSGAPNDFLTADIKPSTSINLMARGAVGVAYFVTPKLSLNASASYWYTLMPDMASSQTFKGAINYSGTWKEDFKPVSDEDPALDIKNKTIKGSGDFSYKKDFDKKNLGLLSISIGIKFWLGRSHTPTPIKAPPIVPPPPAPKMQQKDLLVTVKDRPTGFALSGVKVTVFKNGQPFYTAITNAGGAIPLIKDITPGHYAIHGLLNGIKTNVTSLEPIDFKGDARVINCELLHNDPRFTLVGHTLNANTDARIPHVKTTLNQNAGGENSHQLSDNNGEFRFQLQPGTDYTVFAQQKDFFSNRAAVTTKGLDRSKTLYVDLRLALNELKRGAHFELKNIYYDFDKADIRPDAAKVLDDLYQMLLQNASISIELSSYTDSRGSDSYNMRLSQQRASSAVRYLIEKGIASSRLQAKGYGETMPVNGCINGVPCSEDAHQANRRTEIKIL